MNNFSIDELIATFSTGGTPGVVLFGSQNSMLPSIRPGELIHIAPADRDRLRPGDVVVFRTGESFVAHRLVWKRGFVAWTKGDNNPYGDPAIPVFDIVGVVEGKSSRWAFWYYLMRNRIRHHTPRPVRLLFSELKKKLPGRKRGMEHL